MPSARDLRLGHASRASGLGLMLKRGSGGGPDGAGGSSFTGLVQCMFVGNDGGDSTKEGPFDVRSDIISTLMGVVEG